MVVQYPIVQHIIIAQYHHNNNLILISHLLHDRQVVETGEECLSGGYIDLHPGAAASSKSTGATQQVGIL